MRRWLAWGVALRAALLLLAHWQDAHAAVPYTDVDFGVVVGAARRVQRGGSPYSDPTFRYPPLLALLFAAVLPAGDAAALGPRLLLCGLDLLCAALLGVVGGGDDAVAAGWALNPVAAVLATRGSHEPVVLFPVLLALAAVRRGQWRAAAVAIGVAAHVKLYPAVYAVPLLTLAARRAAPAGVFGVLCAGATLGAGLALGAVLPAVLSWLYYGDDYVLQAVLHHAGRSDVRHNFSVYWLSLYLGDGGLWARLLAAGAPVLALALAAAVGVRYAGDFPFACLMQTLLLIMFNKVLTSQYFAWALVLLPLNTATLGRIAPRPVALALAAAWPAAQALWLAAAHGLEFQGASTHLWVAAAGAALFCVHGAMVLALLRAHRWPAGCDN